MGQKTTFLSGVVKEKRKRGGEIGVGTQKASVCSGGRGNSFIIGLILLINVEK